MQNKSWGKCQGIKFQIRLLKRVGFILCSVQNLISPSSQHIICTCNKPTFQIVIAQNVNVLCTLNSRYWYHYRMAIDSQVLLFIGGLIGTFWFPIIFFNIIIFVSEIVPKMFSFAIILWPYPSRVYENKTKYGLPQDREFGTKKPMHSPNYH